MCIDKPVHLSLAKYKFKHYEFRKVNTTPPNPQVIHTQQCLWKEIDDEFEKEFFSKYKSSIGDTYARAVLLKFILNQIKFTGARWSKNYS